MNLEDRLSQLLRDALDPMLSQHLVQFEQRLVERLAAAVRAAQTQQAHVIAPQPLLTVGEVAKRLKVNKRTIERMVKAGDCPAPIRIGRVAVRWRPSDIDVWLEQQSAQ